MARPAEHEQTTAPHARARLDPAERRARLLAHALRVFARRGLAGGRHAEIARDARVSVPTVFVYFPTREALVAAVLDEVERFYVEMVEATLRLDLPAPELLLALAHAFTASVDTEPERARLWLEWGAALREKSWTRYLRSRITSRSGSRRSCAAAWPKARSRPTSTRKPTRAS